MSGCVGHYRQHPALWWAIHNLIAHPFSEVCHWLRLDDIGGRFHDWTIPAHMEGEGRG